jgi:hypothetical protein
VFLSVMRFSNIWTFKAFSCHERQEKRHRQNSAFSIT